MKTLVIVALLTISRAQELVQCSKQAGGQTFTNLCPVDKGGCSAFVDDCRGTNPKLNDFCFQNPQGITPANLVALATCPQGSDCSTGRCEATPPANSACQDQQAAAKELLGQIANQAASFPDQASFDAWQKDITASMNSVIASACAPAGRGRTLLSSSSVSPSCAVSTQELEAVSASVVGGPVAGQIIAAAVCIAGSISLVDPPLAGLCLLALGIIGKATEPALVTEYGKGKQRKAPKIPQQTVQEQTKECSTSTGTPNVGNGCIEKDLTQGEAKKAAEEACGKDFSRSKVLRSKSAHNCEGKNYVCNGVCDKPGRFPGQETGICIV